MRKSGWGNYPVVEHQRIIPFLWRDQALPHTGNIPLLPHGQGRSYGDVGLNSQGILLTTSPLNRLLAFDPEQGLLQVEAGATLAEILQFIVPRGWFLPVVPGTQFVSVGGAIANDVHGKNHHVMGTFGNHVTSIELLRSDTGRQICSPTQQSDLFKATIAGMGLTGLILSATLRLKRITSSQLTVENIPFNDLDEFFELSAASAASHEYTVAWIDGMAKGAQLGRGIFMRANHSQANDLIDYRTPKKKTLSVPCYFPHLALNPLSIKAFNYWYYRRVKTATQQNAFYAPFFFPLDSILNWNRIYGKNGFMQYQLVIPMTHGRVAIEAIMQKISQSNAASFLSVLKLFGDVASPGLMSFPQPGITLALDFPHRGTKTLKLFNELDQIVLEHGGRLYPAKDAHMSGAMYRAGYPQWQQLTNYIDPSFSSSFWRRVTEDRQ